MTVRPFFALLIPLAWLGPDRHTGFLQRQQIAFDGAGADLEASGQLGSPRRAWRSGAELLDQRVQAVSPIHAGEASIASGGSELGQC